MAATQTEIESQVIELSAEAFDAFCEDISGMFGVDMECAQQEVTSETIKGLEKRFEKLVAVNSVQAEGALSGTFQLVFDQVGLSILSGVVVMMPENRILDEIKRGSIEDVEGMNDAVKEVGNMLVGCWDRVFREGLEGHGHFAQTNIFIGKPWDKPKKTIGLAGNEEFIFVPYEMTIDPYPAFKCGVIFPKTIFESMSEPEAAVEGKDDNIDTEAPDDAVGEKELTTTESKKHSVSETIQEMTQSRAVLPGESAHVSSAISAEDIMQKDVVWGNPDDSVQQAITKMQEHDAGYLMVGIDGALEGIVSNSNIAGALSPYLRPVFAKWHRPLDDATLQIRIKWIMSRPVRTVKPETSLVTIIGNMCQFGQRAFPVVDQQGKVQGLVTAFDIFKVLGNCTNVSMVGKIPEAHPLAQLDSGVGEKVSNAE